MAKGLTLDELKKMGAQPTGGVTLAQLQQQNTPASQPPSDPLNGFATIASSLFGNKGLGNAIGSSIVGIKDTVGKLAHGDLAGAAAAATAGSKEVNSKFGAVTGDVIKDVALPVSLAAGAPAALGKAALQYGALGAAQAGGESLSQGNSLGTVAKDAATGGAIGAVTGGAFNLLGKGINYAASKAGPSALSFTSGVPKNAIEQAASNPGVAKTGLKMSVDEVRHQAVGALQSLHNDLGSEFRNGLTQIGTEAAPGAESLGQKLTSGAQAIAKEFKVNTVSGASGLSADLSSSAIVKGGEVNAVKKALQTVSTWTDFSPQGMQTLSERVGALRNFESGATTKSSAVVGKLYNSVNDAIKETYPQLSQLRTNYATNRTVLDGISNVLSADKTKPVQVQSAVSRLDNLFKENKDEYVNAIRQLSDRSGVDFLSLLAGGEFQKVLPGFIRGLGGGGAVGVGASLINPYLLLLAPLFSPRVVGSIARNASAAASATSQVTRAATAQAIQATVPTKASLLGGSPSHSISPSQSTSPDSTPKQPLTLNPQLRETLKSFDPTGDIGAVEKVGATAVFDAADAMKEALIHQFKNGGLLLNPTEKASVNEFVSFLKRTPNPTFADMNHGLEMLRLHGGDAKAVTDAVIEAGQQHLNKLRDVLGRFTNKK